MRIISQDGRTDFPYEKVIVEIDTDTMCNIMVMTPELITIDQAYLAAKYSTPEKAVKVMQQLHNAYAKHVRASGRVVSSKFYAPEIRFIPPKVFQFPADSEV